MSGITAAPNSWLPKVCLTLAVKEALAAEDTSGNHRTAYAVAETEYTNHTLQSLYRYTVTYQQFDHPTLAKVCICAVITIGAIVVAATTPAATLAGSVIALVAFSFPFIDDFVANRLLDRRAVEEYYTRKNPTFGTGFRILQNEKLLDELIEIQKEKECAILDKLECKGSRTITYFSLYDKILILPSEKKFPVFTKLIENTEESKRKPLLVDYLVESFHDDSHSTAPIASYIVEQKLVTHEDLTPPEQQKIWKTIAKRYHAENPVEAALLTYLAYTLRAHGFDINIKNAYGKTVLDNLQAEQAQDKDAIDALLAWGAKTPVDAID